MFQSPHQADSYRHQHMSGLLGRLAEVSSRPRYAFMLLNLIAEVADKDGSAGPFIRRDGALLPMRDWLCDALTPMGGRAPRRQLLTAKVWAQLAEQGTLPQDRAAAQVMVEHEVRDRVRASGKCNLSRAVSELVKAGLLARHYQGYRVDHHNRGAGRHAVYRLTGRARCLYRESAPPPPTTLPVMAPAAQGWLF